MLSMVQSKDLDCLVLVEETTPPSLFSPRFSTATFFPFPCVGLVLVEEKEKWGGEGRGPPPSLFSSKHPASPTDSQQWTTILKTPLGRKQQKMHDMLVPLGKNN